MTCNIDDVSRGGIGGVFLDAISSIWQGAGRCCSICDPCEGETGVPTKRCTNTIGVNGAEYKAIIDYALESGKIGEDYYFNLLARFVASECRAYAICPIDLHKHSGAFQPCDGGWNPCDFLSRVGFEVDPIECNNICKPTQENLIYYIENHEQLKTDLLGYDGSDLANLVYNDYRENDQYVLLMPDIQCAKVSYCPIGYAAPSVSMQEKYCGGECVPPGSAFDCDDVLVVGSKDHETNCIDGIDNDDDGLVDCEDLDCLLELIDNSSFKSHVIKSANSCTLPDDEVLTKIDDLRDVLLEYGMSTEEAILAAQFELGREEGLIAELPADCPQGNDVFDINGNFLRRQNSLESRILIEINDQTYSYVSNEAQLSADAHQNIAKHYLTTLFSHLPDFNMVDFLATSNVGGTMSVGSLGADYLPNSGCATSFLDGVICCEDIGILIKTSGMPPSTIFGTFYTNRNIYLSSLFHELNHLYAQFPPHPYGDACSIGGEDFLAQSHVIIYYNQFKSSFFQCAKTADPLYLEVMQDVLGNTFLGLIEQRKAKGIDATKLYQWMYCEFLEQLLNDEWKNFLVNEAKYVKDCE